MEMHWLHPSNAKRRKRAIGLARGEVAELADVLEESLTETLQALGAISSQRSAFHRIHIQCQRGFRVLHPVCSVTDCESSWREVEH